MPSLTYTTDNTPHAGVLNSRVLIGRRISPGISLNDPGVSRLHAWIDPVDDQHAGWMITDAGSKTGTFVNDQKITRQPLHDGDRIRIGTITLTYHESDATPRGAKIVELIAPVGVMRGAGILFQCACGAPLWVGNELAGKRGLCRHCRKPVTVPAAETSVPAPTLKAPKSKRAATCAVCHSTIAEGEDITQCPDCAMTFHTECWQENFGCSSYGCPQVNVLKAKEETVPVVESSGAAAVEDEAPQHRWDVMLLAASVVGSVVGAVAFGSTAAIVAVLAVIALIKGKQQQPALLFVAIGISVVGIVADLGVSDFWYFNARHLPAMLRHL